MEKLPGAGADKAADELPKLPTPFGSIDIYEDSGRVRFVDGFTADQMRGYAINYAMQLGCASLAAVPASEPATRSISDDPEFKRLGAILLTAIFNDNRLDALNELARYIDNQLKGSK